MSKYQTVEQVREATAAEGSAFILINGSTGLHSVSPALAANTAVARESGDLTGFYHWSQTVNDSATTPDKMDPVGEAKHFLETVQPKAGDILALDHEEELGTWAQRVDYADRWLAYVAGQTGAWPLLYINGYWLEQLWIAANADQRGRIFGNLWYARPLGTPGDYGTVERYLPDQYPGAHVMVHQYAVDTLPDGGKLDRNWTPDFEALKAIGVH